MAEVGTERDPWAEVPYLKDALEVSGLLNAPPDGMLYHYTSPSGLLGILPSGRVFATDAAFFNDTSEGAYGWSRLAPLLTRFHATGVPGVSKMVSDIIALRRSEPIYVACFCADGDLLGQWQGYAAGGAGYALGFRHAALAGGGLAPLLKVHYGDKEVSGVFERVIDFGLTQFASLVTARSASFTVDSRNLFTAVISTLFMATIASKKEVFRHEQEWRLALPDYAIPGFTPAHVNFRPSEGLVVPYVEVSLPTSAGGVLDLECVVCGPMRHEDRRVDGVRARLSALRLSGVRILVSEAPLRR